MEQTRHGELVPPTDPLVELMLSYEMKINQVTNAALCMETKVLNEPVGVND